MIPPFEAGDHGKPRRRADRARARTCRVAMLCVAIVRTSGFMVTELRSRQLQHRLPPERTAMAATNDVLDGLPKLVALEFYSGIGGLRVSLEKAAAASRNAAAGGVSAERPETASFEINSVANSVRRENQT